MLYGDVSCGVATPRLNFAIGLKLRRRRKSEHSMVQLNSAVRFAARPDRMEPKTRGNGHLPFLVAQSRSSSQQCKKVCSNRADAQRLKRLIILLCISIF